MCSDMMIVAEEFVPLLRRTVGLVRLEIDQLRVMISIHSIRASLDDDCIFSGLDKVMKAH